MAILGMLEFLILNETVRVVLTYSVMHKRQTKAVSWPRPRRLTSVGLNDAVIIK